MTISSQVRTAGPFTGNGVATGGPFSFKVFAGTDLVGVETSDLGVDRTLVYGVDFNVSLNADQNASPGGTINYLIAGVGPSLIPLNYNLNFTSAVANLQPVALTNAGGFFPKVINDALDRLTILVQQLVRGVNASIKFPLSDGTGISSELPNKAARLGKVQAYDPVTGAPVMSTLTLAAIEAGSTSAAASAVLASQWATLTTGLVAATDYSAKAYSIGGTGVTGIIGAAKEWAISASSPNGTTDQSAKTYATNAAASAAAALVSQNAAAASAAAINYRFCGTAGGTANALTFTPGTALSSYTGALLEGIINTANTTEAMTANVSGLGNQNIKVNTNGTKRNPAIGMLQAGMHALFAYDGTDLVIINTPWDNQASDVAAAATVALASATGNFANLTGTGGPVTAITGLSKGRRMLLRHTGVHTLTHSATLFLLNNAQNIITAAGDFSEWVSDGTNVYMTRYHKASGQPINTDLSGITSINGGQLAGNRNVLINGDLKIWQRNPSGAYALTNGLAYGSADRWWSLMSTTAAGIANRDTSVPTPSATTPAFIYSAKVGRNSGSSNVNNIFFGQTVEYVNMAHLAGKKATISFWAKAGANYSSSGSVLNVAMPTGTVADEGSGAGFGGGYTGYVNTAMTPSNVTLTTSWQRFSLTTTAALPTNIKEMLAFFQYTPTGTAGADDNFYITGIQIESGDVATPFEFRSFTTELALCQRYYEKTFPFNSPPVDNGGVTGAHTFASPVGASTAITGTGYPYKVTKRVAPTVTIRNPSGGTAGQYYNANTATSCTGSTTGSIGDSNLTFGCTTPAATAAGHMIAGHLELAAEL